MYIIKLFNDKIVKKLFQNESDAWDWLVKKEDAYGDVYSVSELSTWDLDRVLLMDEKGYFD